MGYSSAVCLPLAGLGGGAVLGLWGLFAVLSPPRGLGGLSLVGGRLVIVNVNVIVVKFLQRSFTPLLRLFKNSAA